MKLLKLSLTLLAIGITSSACAAMQGDGTYFGVSGGYSWDKAASSADYVKEKNKGAAFGVFIGQEVTSNISLEIGANKYADLNYGLANISPPTTLKMQFYNANILLMNRLELLDNISAYVKFGPSYVWEKYSSNITSGQLPISSNRLIRPEAALGAQYKVTDNFAITADYSRIFGVHSLEDDKYLPDLDMAAISFAYYI